MNHRQKSGDEGPRWRSVFRTSNGQRFSQQPVGLRRDGAVISWQRGAGHVGTARADIKAGPTSRKLTAHTVSFCLREKHPSGKEKKKIEPGIRLERGTLRMLRKKQKRKSNKLRRESTFGIPPSGSPLMYSRRLSVGLCLSVSFALKLIIKAAIHF